MENKLLLLDETLGRSFQQGEEGSFEKIYSLYAPCLIDFAARRLESLAEAKDIVQDVFLDLWSKQKAVKIHSLRAYLFSAVRYKIVDHIRKNMQRKYYAALIKTLNTDIENSTLDQVLYNDIERVVNTEISKLPDRTQKVFLLSRRKHLSIREIADEVQVSEQTVKNQLTAALKKLRPVIAKVLVLFFWFFLSK